MNDVLLRVTSREANPGKKTGKLSVRGVERLQKKLEVVKQNGAVLSNQESGWV